MVDIPKTHIKKLQLENFRGAKSLTLELDGRLNVFVGMNGAGKSTVLDAAAILLSWLANRVVSERASGRPITEADIMNGATLGALRIELRLMEGDFSWNVVRARKGRGNKRATSSLKQATVAAHLLRSESIEDMDTLPLIAYYPVDRAVPDIPLRVRMKDDLLDLVTAYHGSLDSGANFRAFFEWFRGCEDVENEIRADLGEDYDNNPEYSNMLPRIHMDAVRRALASFMPGFKDPKVRRSPLRMEIKKAGRVLTVNQLSDGEKCLLAMIGDLARRLAIANPMRDNPLHGDGVILIDEIDLHLHPKWQRMIVPRLLEVFPNCQFLISTHSPHVITHVGKENVFLLDMKDSGLEAAQPSESYGKTAERVLEDLMGLDTTRPKKVEDALGRIYEQIHAGDLNNAEQRVTDLQKQIGNDPQLVRARVAIKRKAVLGK